MAASASDQSATVGGTTTVQPVAAATVRDTHSALCGYCIYHYTNNTYNSRATILRGGGGPSFCPSLLAQWYNSLYSKAAQLQQQNQLQRVDLWVNNPIRQQLGPALVS